jgi:hypothetical protein
MAPGGSGFAGDVCDAGWRGFFTAFPVLRRALAVWVAFLPFVLFMAITSPSGSSSTSTARSGRARRDGGPGARARLRASRSYRGVGSHVEQGGIGLGRVHHDGEDIAAQPSPVLTSASTRSWVKKRPEAAGIRTTSAATLVDLRTRRAARRRHSSDLLPNHLLPEPVELVEDDPGDQGDPLRRLARDQRLGKSTYLW